MNKLRNAATKSQFPFVQCFDVPTGWK